MTKRLRFDGNINYLVKIGYGFLSSHWGGDTGFQLGLHRQGVVPSSVRRALYAILSSVLRAL